MSGSCVYGAATRLARERKRLFLEFFLQIFRYLAWSDNQQQLECFVQDEGMPRDAGFNTNGFWSLLEMEYVVDMAKNAFSKPWSALNDLNDRER
jgi:hypothetical protein